MKRVMMMFVICAGLTACSSGNSTDEVISKEDVMSMDSSALNTVVEDKFSGDFSGEVGSKNVSLNIKKGEYTLKVNDKTYKGKFFLLDDGNQIELEGEKLPYSVFYFSAEGSLLIMNKDGSFPEEEKEYFLTK